MKYNCKVLGVIDDDEVTIKIGDVEITGFVSTGFSDSVGSEKIVDISLYGDLKISESGGSEILIIKKDKTFAHSLYGTLDVDNATLNSLINFELEKEDVFNFGYLDGKMVKIDVLRIDFCFE